MQKIILVFLCLFLVGLATAGSICPFDPPDGPEGLPPGTSIKSLTVGSVYGFSMVSQENVWQTWGNETGIQSNQYNSLSYGILNIALEDSLSTKMYGYTSSTARAIEFQGQGMSFRDSSLFESISGIDPESCEQVIGGASAMFRQGAYGSETLGMISPGNGITMQQEIGTGEAAPVKPSGFQGVITFSGSTFQIYDGMAQTSGSSATFGGISSAVHSFKFNTMTE